MTKDELRTNDSDSKEIKAIFIGGEKRLGYIYISIFLIGILFFVLSFILMTESEIAAALLILALLFIPIGALLFLKWKKIASQKLTVTYTGISGVGQALNWRIKGTEIDLPMDSITSISLRHHSLTRKGISFSTPSGNISFSSIKNSKEIYDFVKQRINERQVQNKNQVGELAESLKNNFSASSKADELKKLFDLKQSGIISEEEYQNEKDKLFK